MYQIKCHPMANGMNRYYLPVGDPTTNIFIVGFRAGSIYDPPEKKGLAHAVEHSICRVHRRCEDPHRIDLALRRHLGGPDEGYKIFTSHSAVAYGHANLVSRAGMYAMAELFSAFVHPYSRIVDKNGIEGIESAAIRNEFHLYGTDYAPAVVDELLYKTLYTTNPVKWRIDGLLDHIRSFTHKDGQRFAHRYYVPRNAFVLVLGPKKEIAVELTERHFGGWNTPTSVPILDYDHSDDVPELAGIRSVFEQRNINQYHFGMAWPTEVYDTEDDMAIDVLAEILEMRAWRIREDNMDPNAGAYRIAVSAHRTIVNGIVTIWFATTDREYVKKGENILLEEAVRLRTQLPSREELEIAVGTLARRYREAFKTTPDNLADMIIDATTNGDPELAGIHSFLPRLHRINRHKIRDVANKYLNPKAYVRAVVGPDDPYARV
jgi:predicted Zn-dependent peptidase